MNGFLHFVKRLACHYNVTLLSTCSVRRKRSEIALRSLAPPRYVMTLPVSAVLLRCWSWMNCSMCASWSGLTGGIPGSTVLLSLALLLSGEAAGLPMTFASGGM